MKPAKKREVWVVECRGDSTAHFMKTQAEFQASQHRPEHGCKPRVVRYIPEAPATKRKRRRGK